MKMSVSWHKQNLKCGQSHLDRLLANIQELEVAVARWREDNELLRSQIEAAEAEGRDSFDADKYRVKRGKNG